MKILPCPVCGKEPEKIQNYPHYWKDKMVKFCIISCESDNADDFRGDSDKECPGLSHEVTVWGRTVKEAVVAWNKLSKGVKDGNGTQDV